MLKPKRSTSSKPKRLGKSSGPARTSIDALVLQMEPCFSNQDLEALRQLVIENSRPAEVEQTGNNYYQAEYRRSRIVNLDVVSHEWVFSAVWKAAVKANQTFGFEIEGIREQIQIALYDAAEEGFFGWHMDCSANIFSRKISISMPLNNPDEYEGGSLQFLLGSGEPMTASQKMGDIVAFPSFLIHRVTPVTKGTRYSLVCWVHGPGWK